jgi:hypothetical protein
VKGNMTIGLSITPILAVFALTTACIAQEPDSTTLQRPLSLNDPLKNAFQASLSTAADQFDVAVTVYNNDLALVRDQRRIAFFPGEVSLTFMDVAQRIMPETVSLRSISDPGALNILEQNYEYDLMSPEKLLEKFVGRGLRLRNFSNEVGFIEVEGELLSVSDGPIYRIDNEIFLGHPGTVVLPEIPENLVARPSLIWLLSNEGMDQEVEVSYLTRGISWKADYVLTLSEHEDSVTIEAWVTLDNRSGAAYTNARLKLVAGEVNRVSPEPAFVGGALKALAAAPAPMAEESFAEYHLYSLARRTTIKDKQTKQVSLFTATNVGVSRTYEFRGNTAYYRNPVQTPRPEIVSVYLNFENREENQLGLPLPEGVMRIYQEDAEGMLQFAGEDRIRHTPKDESVRLRLGAAFDVVGERVQTNFDAISRNIFESSFEIRMRNHKETAVTVDVVEPLPWDWDILESSEPFTKKDAQTAAFKLTLEPGGEKVLTYRVRVAR